MTDAKCREVLDRYALDVEELRRHHPDSAAHLATMLPTMRGMLDTALRLGQGDDVMDFGPAYAQREKFMRWLGFVQGVFYAQGVYTIEQMKAHNCPDE